MADWLSFSQSSGSGDTQITVTASSYSGNYERTTDIIVNGYSKNVAIPTVQYGRYAPQPEAFYQNYLTFEILTGGTIVWCCQVGNSEYQKTVEYRINGGAWTSITSKKPSTSTPRTIDPSCVFSVSAGDIVEWRGNNAQYGQYNGNGMPVYYAHFKGDGDSYGGTATYNVYGNIMSLAYGDNFVGNDDLRAASAFLSLFYNSNAVYAHNLCLPATSLTDNCYFAMFCFSHKLLTAPKLPATSLGVQSYCNMFNMCDSLTIPPPVLPALSIPYFGYNGMFHYCNNLLSAPSIEAVNLSELCCGWMFSECTSLTQVGPLLATGSAAKAYYHMFDGCTNLAEITCMLQNVSNRDYCLNEWVKDVSASGVFHKDRNVEWPTGNNGIPTGWTVQNV